MNARLTVWMDLLTRPFDCAKCGLEVVCLKSHSFEKHVNSLAMYSGPLSENNSCGIPWRANIIFSLVITDMLVVLGIHSSSMYPE